MPLLSSLCEISLPKACPVSPSDYVNLHPQHHPARSPAGYSLWHEESPPLPFEPSSLHFYFPKKVFWLWQAVPRWATILQCITWCIMARSWSIMSLHLMIMLSLYTSTDLSSIIDLAWFDEIVATGNFKQSYFLRIASLSIQKESSSGIIEYWNL